MNDIEILEVLSRKIEEQNSIIASCCSIVNKKAEAKERTEYIEIKKFVENLIKENKELEEKNKILESLLQGNLFEMYKYYKELCSSYQGNSISKDKVKEKIERKFLGAKGLYERGVQPQAQYTMKLLRDLEKELLEGE